MKLAASKARLLAALGAPVAGLLLSSSPIWAQDPAEAPAEEMAAETAPAAETGVSDAAPDAAPSEAPADSTAQAEAPAEAAPAEGEAAAAPVDTIPVEPAREEQKDLAVEEGGDKTKLDTIEVTGSRIKRSDYETSQPVTIVSREDIERSGLNSIGDILQNLPQAGAAINTAFNNGGDGSIEIDLRNLGSERVLVLVNGRRWVNGLSSLRTGAVDLTTIPVSIIESVEILKDGASAIYGSDAIAGVVNIKLRKNFSGAEVRGQVGATDQGDGTSEDYSFAVGSVAGKTSVFANASYFKQGPVFAGDRELASFPVYGTGISRGSSFTPEARILFVPTPTNGQIIAGGNTGDDTPCYDIGAGVVNGAAGDAILPTIPGAGPVPLCDLAGFPNDYVRFDQNLHSYNFAPINYLVTPSERSGIFTSINHQVSDTVNFSAELLYNVRKSAQQLAETPLGVGDALPRPFNIAYVDATNIYNPTNPQSPYYIPGTTAQDIGRGDPGAAIVGLGAVLRRMVEMGPRVQKQNVDTYRVGGGFDGVLDIPVADLSINWDVGAALSESRTTDELMNNVNMLRVAAALGPDANCRGTTLPDGTFVPPPAANFGCVPLDMFGGPGTITPEMINFIRADQINTARQRQRYAYANFSTILPQLQGILPAAPGLAFGAEYRKEFFASTPDPLAVAGITSGLASTKTKGQYDVSEAYAEVSVPALRDLPFAQELDLSAAARYSQYSAFGDNLSGKFGVRWKVVDDLLVRGTWSDSFRAPSIGNLFLGRATSFPEVDDPCSDYQNSDNPNAQQNCAADNVDPNYSQTNGQISTVFGGNPDLEPETAETLSFGFVYSPSQVPDLNFTIDWYQIELENFITVPGAAVILDLCYNSPPDQRSACEFVNRSPSGTGQVGEINELENVFTNLAEYNVTGVDFNADWRLPFEFLEPFGSFKVVADVAYTIKQDFVQPGPGGQDVVIGLLGRAEASAPRWKANTSLDWSLGDFEASWATRIIYHTEEFCDDGFGAEPPDVPSRVLSLAEAGLCSDPNNPEGPKNELETTFYHDVQGSYNFAPFDLKFVVGVNNVLDQDPPPFRTAFASSFDPSLYDYEGSRTFYGRFIKSF